MKPGLDPGLFAEASIIVTPDLCPHFDGLPLHPVLATWHVVQQMEIAGRKLLVPFLEEDDEGIGARISVDHVSPAALGATVITRATVTSFEAGRLITAMESRAGELVIARGEFVQVILPRTKLVQILHRAKTKAADASRPPS